MQSISRRRIGRGQRGQIMILGALGVLLVALMMLLTLNVGQSVFEKIRIQQYSDASAFSIATQNARTFNFFAYTNRANIGSLVAAASAHSFMSMASTIPEMFKAAKINFIMMAVIIEIPLCCSCGSPVPCCKIKHCIEAIRDFRAASKYSKGERNFRKAVKELDKKFIRVIRMLDLHMQFISFSQLEMKLRVGMQIMSDGLTKDLRDEFAPQASGNAMGVTGLNLAEFGMVFEGDTKMKKWVPTEIANGSRWDKFVFNRGMGTPILFIHLNTLWDFTRDKYPKPAKGTSVILHRGGQARIIKGANGNPEGRITRTDRGPDGNAAASFDKGLVLSQAFCGVWIWPYKAYVGSNKDSGDHYPSSACEGKSKHKNFKCLGGGNCFTLFKANENASDDFGQPKAYSLVSQDLRMMPEGGQGPWEITDSGEINVDLGGDVGKRGMQISDDPGKFGEGMAMSKAMTYYHLPTDWKEHPNFFNPFWKAKLQPFRGSAEAIKVLVLGGAAKYIPVVVSGAPLP